MPWLLFFFPVGGQPRLGLNQDFKNCTVDAGIQPVIRLDLFFAGQNHPESPLLQSVIAKSKAGDPLTKRLVHACHHRPAVELFDTKANPLEMHSIGGQADIKKRKPAFAKNWCYG